MFIEVLKSISKWRDRGVFAYILILYLGNDKEFEAEIWHRWSYAQMMKISSESRFLGFFADF